MLYDQPFGAAAIAEIVCARVAQSGTPARPRAVRCRSSRAGGAEACGWTGARQAERWNSVEIQPSWSVSTVVRTVLCNDALYTYEATDYRKTAQLMSELSNHWLCRLQPELMSLCRRSGDGRALRTHALTMQRSNPTCVGRHPACTDIKGRRELFAAQEFSLVRLLECLLVEGRRAFGGYALTFRVHWQPGSKHLR